MTEEKIWLSPPHLGDKELQYVQEAFSQNWIAPYGENIDVFEEALERHFAVPDVALVNSGTAAIHLSLVVAGVKQGDEVVVPSLNFAGCINPVLYQGATPLLVDSESETWNADPDLIEEIILDRIRRGRKPKAIIAVHLFGIPCKIEEIILLGEKYGIDVIEDAADAIGATYKGKPLGSFGRMGIISFNGNKVLTTSGGGALLAQNADDSFRAKYLSNQARKPGSHYIHEEVGFNYMLSNVLAGIGRGQLVVLEERLARRREIYEIYSRELTDTADIYFPQDLPHAVSNRWLSVGMLQPRHGGSSLRDGLHDYLAALNIETRPVWRPMHMQPAYQHFPYYGGRQAEMLHTFGICLPSGSSLTESQQERVIDCIKTYFRQSREQKPVMKVG